MKIIFDLISCPKRPSHEFDWENYKKGAGHNYFDYEKWIASGIIEWCNELKLSYKIKDHKWAMQIVFDFKYDKEAALFILKWMDGSMIERVSSTNNGKWIL